MVVQIPEMDFGWIIPEIVVTVFAIATLLLTLFRKKNGTWLLVEDMPLIGAILALYYTFQLWNGNLDIFNNLYTIDNFGTFFKGLVLVILILVTLLSYRYVDREDMVRGEYYALLLYGIALIYGTTGMLDIREVAGYVNSGRFMVTPTFMAGLALLIVGFGF